MRNASRLAASASVLLAAGMATASAAAVQVPALLDPATNEHHPGKVAFVELITPDLAAAEQFYGGLFGWTFRDMQAGTIKYAEASLNGDAVAGLVHKDIPAGEHRQPAWLTFLAVRDLDAATRAARAHGAKVLREPHAVPNRGHEAVLTDPQGAVFGLLASSSGDPSEALADPGEWIWSSLITTDPDTDAAFYQTVFDYEVFELPADPGMQHLMLASEDYARASVNSLPANMPGLHPHWLNYVRVLDAQAMVDKAVALGGKVLVSPHEDRHGGMIAVVADPAGAPFGLIEWTASQTKEVTK